MSREKNEKVKKQSAFRTFIQCISFAFHNGYVSGWAKGKIYSGSNKAFCVPGLNCYSCPGAVGACPIGSLQAVLDGAGFNISLYVIGFIGIVGIICGRFVCGWLCPFGLVQDLCHKIPLLKKVKNLPGHKYLRYLRFVILAVFVIALPMGVKNQAGVGQPWFCEYICPSGTLLGGIPLVAANAEFQAIIGIRYFWKILLLLLILAAAVKYDRPFCKYICPLGALYGMVNPVSLFRLQVDSDKCVKCGACQRACGVDIRVWENPNSMDCIRCGKCKAVCPTGAISGTFCGIGKAAEVSTVSAQAGISSAQAGISGVQAEETLSTGRKIKAYIAAVLEIIIGTGALLFIAVMMCVMLTSGSLENIVDYIKYLYGYLAAAVPAVMTFVLGIKLITGKKLESVMSELGKWPVRILITTGICILAVYIGYAILTVMLAGQFVIEVFTYPLVLMQFPFIIMAALGVMNLIVLLLIRNDL